MHVAGVADSVIVPESASFDFLESAEANVALQRTALPQLRSLADRLVRYRTVALHKKRRGSSSRTSSSNVGAAEIQNSIANETSLKNPWALGCQ